MIGRRSHDEAQSFDEGLRGRVPRDEQLADLVRFAEDLCEAAATVEPSMSFRASLRSQLMTEAATVLVPTPAATRPLTVVPAESTGQKGRRRVATLTATLVASAGVVGIVASSASAVPGDMLYSVKRSVENVELQLHRDDTSRGSFQLAQASERLAEARHLTADGASTDLIAASLDDFAAAATKGSDKLFSAYSSTGEEQAIREVNDFAASSSTDLAALATQLSDAQVDGPADGLADSITQAASAVSGLATQASSLCASCRPADLGSLLRLTADAAKATTVPTATAPVAPAQSGRVKASTPSAPAQRTPAAGSSSAAPRSTTSTTPPATSAPAPVVKTPSLSTLTDPLLVPLLGNETTPGLVPDLLNGLLGGGTSK